MSKTSVCSSESEGILPKVQLARLHTEKTPRQTLGRGPFVHGRNVRDDDEGAASHTSTNDLGNCSL